MSNALAYAASGLAALKEGGYRHYVLTYESLIKTPCRVSKEILDFLPELMSLNPARTGLRQARLSGERLGPLLGYALQKAQQKSLLSSVGMRFGQHGKLSSQDIEVAFKLKHPL